MAFDWLRFLQSYNVHYVDTGPNVSRNHVAVKCPWCGAADKSEHMSINLNGKGWRCFRNREQHKGISPVGLVAALLGTTIENARAIVGTGVAIPSDFMGAVMSKMQPPDDKPARKLKLPPEFKPLDDRYSSRKFVNYLTGPSRRFALREIWRMTKDYDIMVATQGPQKDRVIFPIYFEGKLVSWTGRTIHTDVDLRYKTLSTDPDVTEHPAAGPINDYLLWYDDLQEIDADTLCFVEGPFDALKVNVIGRRHGICATCFFTASPSARQIDLMHDLVSRFRRKALLLDQGTIATMMRTQALMPNLRIPFKSLPSGIKDPGLLTELSLLELFD